MTYLQSLILDRTCSTLKVLNLCDHHIGVDGVRALAAVNFGNLTNLDLSNNQIGDDGKLLINLYLKEQSDNSLECMHTFMYGNTQINSPISILDTYVIRCILQNCKPIAINLNF
jgi:hypothetical protein